LVRGLGVSELACVVASADGVSRTDYGANGRADDYCANDDGRADRRADDGLSLLAFRWLLP